MTWDGPERRVEQEPLVEQLKRVDSGMSFRRWTRTRMFFLALALVLDIFATFVAGFTYHLLCAGLNQQRAAEVRLWTDLVAKNPPTPLPPEPTPAQIEEVARVSKQTRDFFESLHRNFAPEKCLL